MVNLVIQDPNDR